MVSFPPCKINLGLNILRKRADGYHDLETCFYPLPWTDILEIVPSQEFQFASTGAPIPEQGDNLCVRAYRELQKKFDLPAVAIHLHKIIPTGAGLGGGSADAAHTLRLLNQMFELKLTLEQMGELASALGSDCAFFLQDQCRMGTGRGEILSPLSLSLHGKFLIVVKPPVHISTAEAYAAVVPQPAKISLRSILENQPLHTWRDMLKNDFEKSILPRYPAIQKIKDALYEHGAVYASMSGSGSSVFGIYESEVHLNFPGDHVTWSGRLATL